MSYQYLDLKRVKNAMQLGLTALAKKEFDGVSLSLWLQNTHEHYRISNIRSVIESSAQDFLMAHEAPTSKAMASLSEPGRLLMDAVLHACKMPVRGELDKNLQLIDSTFRHAQQLSQYPIDRLNIKYSLKKHRDDLNLRLMTVRGDVLGEFGLEAAGLCLSALTKALSREMGLKISIWNLHEVFGPDHGKSRVAPSYSDNDVFYARRMFVDYVCGCLTLNQVKDGYGVIKAVCNHFQTLEVPPQ
jgi:hypothetical protein